jgi:hypothetical protein
MLGLIVSDFLIFGQATRYRVDDQAKHLSGNLVREQTRIVDANPRMVSPADMRNRRRDPQWDIRQGST